MSAEFGRILRGLMANRRLTRGAVAHVSERAESTINQLLVDRIAPTVELLQDIAPAIQVPLADLLVIAGLPTDRDPDWPEASWRPEMGSLLAAASWLTRAQLQQVKALALELKAQNT